MTSTTQNLSLPYIAAGQAQKHVTHNQALDLIDSLLFLAVETAGTNTPPASPAEGNRYIVGPAPTGGWAGHAEAIALWQEAVWVFLAPAAGWQAWVAATEAFQVFDGQGWQAMASGGSGGGSDTLGIHTTADTTNRLAVASAASLFTHDGAGHQLKINKASSTATASLLFQTNFSGRAEIGLAGNDQLQLKTSLDGNAWTTPLTLTGDGKVAINAVPTAGSLTISGTDTSGQVPDFQVYRQNTWTLAFYETYSSESAFHSPFSIMRRARGSLAAPAAVQNGDQIGGFSFRAYNSNGSFQQTALVSAVVNGVPAGNSIPTDLSLCAGSTAANERVRILSTGDVGIGTAQPSTKLHVNGPIRVGSSTVAALPSAATLGAGTILYVSNASGGAELAFSDGTSWRRASDRTVVS